MINLSSATFNYTPFPFGVAQQVIDPAIYKELCENFPETSLFANTATEYGTTKYGLSTAYNPEKYKSFLSENSAWKKFAKAIDTPEFIAHVLKVLKDNNIDLDLEKKRFCRPTKLERFKHTISSLMRCEWPQRIPYLRTRFEFSAIPASNGSLLPHTDSPKKIISLVLTMRGKDDWKNEKGGNTDMLVPIEEKHNFNWINYQLPFEKVKKIASYGYNPNQCLIFVKTFNSWHSVGPMYNPESKAFRKTVTINITY